jgi:DNA-binding response OmpR family regulator
MTKNEDLVEGSSKLILIVEDDASILELLETMVKSEGFRASTIRDGEDALRQACDLKPDLILLDLMLPGLGGFEVVRRLQTGETAKIPVIVVTARRMDHSTRELILQERNVKDFLEKPINPSVLALALHGILQTNPPELGKAPGGS